MAATPDGTPAVDAGQAVYQMDDPTLDRNLMLAQIGELTLRLGAMAEHLRVALEQRDQAAADATEARRQLAAAKPAPRSRPKR